MRYFLGNLNSTKVTGSIAITFFLIQFLWWLFEPSHLIPIWSLMLALIIMWIVWIVTYTVCSRDSATNYTLPTVRKIHFPEDNKNSSIVFIADKSDLYSMDSLVSIYYNDDADNSGMEILLGIGYVETITSIGYPQIVFVKVEEGEKVSKIINSLRDDKKSRQNTIIKLSIPKIYLGER